MHDIPGRVRGRRDDAGLAADGDDVGGVPAAGPLAVVGVDGAALEGGHGAFEATRLVEGVRVDSYLPPRRRRVQTQQRNPIRFAGKDSQQPKASDEREEKMRPEKWYTEGSNLDSTRQDKTSKQGREGRQGN